MIKHCHHRQYAVSNHAANPPRSHTQGGNAGYEDNDRCAFIPGSVAQSEVMLVSAGAIENLSYQSQDIDCCNHDGTACNDCPYAVERIGMLERTGEDGHFGNETAESG